MSTHVRSSTALSPYYTDIPLLQGPFSQDSTNSSSVVSRSGLIYGSVIHHGRVLVMKGRQVVRHVRTNHELTYLLGMLSLLSLPTSTMFSIKLREMPDFCIGHSLCEVQHTLWGSSSSRHPQIICSHLPTVFYCKRSCVNINWSCDSCSQPCSLWRMLGLSPSWGQGRVHRPDHG